MNNDPSNNGKPTEDGHNVMAGPAPIFPITFRCTIDAAGQVSFETEPKYELNAFHLWSLGLFLQKVGDRLDRGNQMREMMQGQMPQGPQIQRVASIPRVVPPQRKA